MDGYAKVFRTMYTGSMYGAGPYVFALWGWVLAHKDECGHVDINVDNVAHAIGGTPEGVKEALLYLTSPDKQSRCKDKDGRRLVKCETEFEYFVVTNDKYRDQGKDRTEYWREYKRKKRAEEAKKRDNDSVHSGQSGLSTNSTQAEAEAKAKAKALKPNTHMCFKPPKKQEVQEYFDEKGYPDVADDFWNYMTGSDWHDSKGRKVKYWKQNAATFIAIRKNNGKPKPAPPECKPIDTDNPYIKDLFGDG